jgi:hypothetical protein
LNGRRIESGSGEENTRRSKIHPSKRGGITAQIHPAPSPHLPDSGVILWPRLSLKFNAPIGKVNLNCKPSVPKANQITSNLRCRPQIFCSNFSHLAQEEGAFNGYFNTLTRINGRRTGKQPISKGNSRKNSVLEQKRFSMSSSRHQPNSADLYHQLKALHKTILNTIDGFDFVKNGNLGVLQHIQTHKFQLTNYPQYGRISHKQMVSDINWSIRGDALEGFPEPPNITVEAAIQVAKALEKRDGLAKSYSRMSSACVQDILANYNLDLAKDFHNIFLHKIRRGDS